jgi:hypothetical protein
MTMPYPDSEYPSVLRGYDKRQSQRLLAASPDLLAALRYMIANAEAEGWSELMLSDAKDAIAKAEGRPDA